MYVKIVRYLEERGVVSNNNENIVVPKSILIIECESVEYKKLKVLDINEFNVYMKYNEIYTHRIVGKWSWDIHNIINLDLTVDQEKSCEFILIYYSKGNKSEYLVAPNCSMYLMGDDGKTIDSLRCK